MGLACVLKHLEVHTTTSECIIRSGSSSGQFANVEWAE